MAGLDDYDLRSLITMGNRTLREMLLPVDSAGWLELSRRLDELSAALSTVKTRLEVVLVLSRVPGATSGVGTSPLASEAADRLRRALINVMAINVRAQRDT